MWRVASASFFLLALNCWQSCDDVFDFTSFHRGANLERIGFQYIIVSWIARHLTPHSLGIKVQLKMVGLLGYY